MKSLYPKIFLLCAFILNPISLQAAWEPTFVDNFDGDKLSDKSWVNGRENLPQRLHYYHKDAVEVNGGKLNIKVLNRSYSDRPYTTGAVTTQGLFAQKYGYFEIRAKMPKGAGFWPAFWLMPTSGKWTSEIDIVEFIGDKPDTPHYAFHYDYSQKNEHSHSANAGKDLSLGYNTYGLKWTPNRLEYYLNGKLMHTIQGSYIVGKADSPMYIILNLALASRHTGWIKGVDKSTNLSQKYSIDYIRVYKESNTGKYKSIPGYQVAVPNKLSTNKYDNTPVSIEPIVDSGHKDVMRSPGHISGKLIVTGHSQLNTDLRITLFELKDFDKASGKYSKSSAIETINNSINFSKAGERREVPYKFSKYINRPGAYAVDVVVRDNGQGHKNAVNAHRIIQYLDKNKPDTTVFFDGFIKSGLSTYTNGKVYSSVNLMLHESMLSPYVISHYSVINNRTNAVIKSKRFDSYIDKPGEVKLNANFDATLNSSDTYSLIVNVLDSSGKIWLDYIRVPVILNQKTYTSQSVTSISTDDTLHALYGVKSSPDFSLIFDASIAKGAQVNDLNYIVKLYSIDDGSLIRKISGTYTGNLVNGRQTLKITTGGGYQMTSSDYRANVILYKDGWNPADIVIQDSMNVNVATR